MPCGWEGNCRSGVALAMRHALQWFIHPRAHGLMKGDKHPVYTPHEYSAPACLGYIAVSILFQSHNDDDNDVSSSSSRSSVLTSLSAGSVVLQ